MTAHKHAELMAQYAEDAKTTKEPWFLWETRDKSSDWKTLWCGPLWANHNEYRRKPKTIIVTTANGELVTWPAPMTQAPELGTRYYLVLLQSEDLFAPNYWVNDRDDQHWLPHGLCHATKEAAIAHAKALIKLSGGAV